jgi:hypothetical protein
MTPQEILASTPVGKLISIELEGTGESENPKIMIRVPQPRKIRHILMKYLPQFQFHEDGNLDKNLDQQNALLDWAFDWLAYAEKHTWGGESEDIDILDDVFQVREDIAISFGIGTAELAMRILQGEQEAKKNLSTTSNGTKPETRQHPEKLTAVSNA